MRKYVRIFFLLISVLLFASCVNDFSGNGILEIKLPGGKVSRNAGYYTAQDALSYIVLITDANGNEAGKAEGRAGDVLFIENLLPGSYAVTAFAYGEDGQVIASGSETAIIRSGITENVVIKLTAKQKNESSEGDSGEGTVIIGGNDSGEKTETGGETGEVQEGFTVELKADNRALFFDENLKVFYTYASSYSKKDSDNKDILLSKDCFVVKDSGVETTGYEIEANHGNFTLDVIGYSIPVGVIPWGKTTVYPKEKIDFRMKSTTTEVTVLKENLSDLFVYIQNYDKAYLYDAGSDSKSEVTLNDYHCTYAVYKENGTEPLYTSGDCSGKIHGATEPSFEIDLLTLGIATTGNFFVKFYLEVTNDDYKNLVDSEIQEFVKEYTIS